MKDNDDYDTMKDMDSYAVYAYHRYRLRKRVLSVVSTLDFLF